MMRIIKAYLMFYKRILIPLLSITLAFGIIGLIINGSFASNILGFAIIFCTPLLQYFIYEIRYPKEYYFYYNFGLSKGVLWVSTFILGYIIGLSMILL